MLAVVVDSTDDDARRAALFEGDLVPAYPVLAGNAMAFHLGYFGGEVPNRPPNVDARCTRSAIRDFVRVNDFTTMPVPIVAMFADGTEDRGDLVYSGG